ncbi:MAG: DUF3078 domain-containing protein [Flavobacteriales bacterium]
MKNLILTCAVFLISVCAIAQDLSFGDQKFSELESKSPLSFEVVAEVDTSWKQGGLIGFNASQTLLNNWAAGGQSSVTGTAYLNLFRNYAKGKVTWDNTLDLSYGVLNQGIIEGNNIKIDDRIDFASKFGRQATDHWYYSALVNFRSQFAPGYEIVDGAENKDNKISDLLAPAFLIGSIGMDYKPNDNFTAFISPITSKNTIVNAANSDLRGAYGFDVDEFGLSDDAIRFELGAYARFAYKRDLAENAQYQGRLDLFSNYLNNPQNVDVNFENIIAVKLAKYFNVNFILQLVYDDDIAITQQVNDSEGNQVLIDNEDGTFTGETRGVSTLQLRQVFGLGFSYKF